MFRPLKPITLAEMSALMSRGLSLPVTNGEYPLAAENVQKWALPSIRSLLSAGILKDQTIRGSSLITRESLAVWYVRALGLYDQVRQTGHMPTFKDASSISEEARTSVWAAQELHLFQGDEQQRFNPKEWVDRQCAAKVTTQVYLLLKDRQQIQNLLKPGNAIPGDPSLQLPQETVIPKATVMENRDISDPQYPVHSDAPTPVPSASPELPTPAPSASPEPPSPAPSASPELQTPAPPAFKTVDSIHVTTDSIDASFNVSVDSWKLAYVTADVYGTEITPDLLPPDLKVSITDDYSILAPDGTIARFYNIPGPGTVIHGLIRLSSNLANFSTASNFELRVKPAEYNSTSYFTVSLLLEDTGASATTIAEMETMRDSLATIDPNLRVTWAMDSRFVFDETQRPQLHKVLEYVDLYGDEVGIASGYPNNIYNLSQWITEMNSWLYMYRYNALNALHQGGTNGDPSVWLSIPDKYRPKSLSTYAINPEQAAWLKENFQIDAFMGWAATQYNVGQMSADGSPLMPYWSHIDNPMVPAQDVATNSGSIFMNSLSIDPIGSRYTSGASRWTLHPADPFVMEMTAVPQLHLASQYLNNPFLNLNTVNYLSLVIGTNWVLRTPGLDVTWQDFISRFPKDNGVKILGVHDLAEIYKTKSANTNDQSEFTLMFRGSGYTTATGENSPADLQYLWTETATERIILAKKDSEPSWRIIDFTDYFRLPVAKLPYTTNGIADDISYITGRNYKLNPSAPLTPLEIERVRSRLEALKFKDDISYQ